MSTATLPRVEPADTDGDDDGHDHVFHCDPNVAICGADLTGYVEEPFAAADNPDTCPLCLVAIQCGHYCPACRKPVTS